MSEDRWAHVKPVLCEHITANHVAHEWNDADGLRKKCPGRQDIPFDAYPGHVESSGQDVYSAPLIEVGKTIQRWADNAMFSAAPLDKEEGPKVYLLSMTPDPLGTIAAVNQMYVGKPVRSLADVTDNERREHWQRVIKTRLKAPFEFVKFHFMIEGVTRAFTHQMVRQRTATFAQESLRFAVVEDDFTSRVALPPSLAGTTGEMFQERARIVKKYRQLTRYGDDHGTQVPHPSWTEWQEFTARGSEMERKRYRWDLALEKAQDSYSQMIEDGMPAEDARGLLPTNILTRLHYTTDLRALLEHAGNRLCTQAQFEWRLVWARMIEAIRDYRGIYRADVSGELGGPPGTTTRTRSSDWQQEEISKLFKPICYQTGKCEFMSPDDRACSIRARVQVNAEIGRKPEQWAEEYDEVEGNPIMSGFGPQSVVREHTGKPVFIGAIKPVEWLADPTAARRDGGGHIGRS